MKMTVDFEECLERLALLQVTGAAARSGPASPGASSSGGGGVKPAVERAGGPRSPRRPPTGRAAAAAAPDPERVRQPRLALREGRGWARRGTSPPLPLPWPLPRAERPRGRAHPFRGMSGVQPRPRRLVPLRARVSPLPLAARPSPSLPLLRFHPHTSPLEWRLQGTLLQFT